jgi:hypothetical protein
MCEEFERTESRCLHFRFVSLLVTVYSMENSTHRRRQRARNRTTTEVGRYGRGVLGVDRPVDNILQRYSSGCQKNGHDLNNEVFVFPRKAGCIYIQAKAQIA